jgi:hypothetical protein
MAVHWSCRKLAATPGLGKSTAQRIWSQARVKPHRLERYITSDDPQFEKKALDIIALYLDPPTLLLFSASMKRRRFRRWTAWTLCFHTAAFRSRSLLNQPSQRNRD